jgi:hypothetical protein
MTLPRPELRRLVFALVVLLLGACAPAPTATPFSPTATLAPQPTATAPPAATSLPTARATTAATADPYAGWQTVATSALSIRLPADWQAVDLSGEDAAALLTQLRAQQSFLADVAGDVTAQDAALVAVGPQRDGPADSLTIRRTPLGAERVTDLRRQVIDLVLPQYEQLGFAPVAGPDDGHTEAGLPLASVTYELPGGDGLPPVRGQQFFIAADSDLWILTFSAFPAPGRLDPDAFGRAAASFQLR